MRFGLLTEANTIRMNHFFGNNQNRGKNYNSFIVNDFTIGSTFYVLLDLYDNLASYAIVSVYDLSGNLSQTFPIQEKGVTPSQLYSIIPNIEDFEIRVYGRFINYNGYDSSINDKTTRAEINIPISSASWQRMFGVYGADLYGSYKTEAEMVADQSNQTINKNYLIEGTLDLFVLSLKTGSISDYTLVGNYSERTKLIELTINMRHLYSDSDIILANFCENQTKLVAINGLDNLVYSLSNSDINLSAAFTYCFSLETAMPTEWFIYNTNANSYGACYKSDKIPNYTNTPLSWRSWTV